MKAMMMVKIFDWVIVVNCDSGCDHRGTSSSLDVGGMTHEKRQVDDRTVPAITIISPFVL